MTQAQKNKINRERVAKFKLTRPWYDIYQAARQKCQNKKHPAYKYFGAKGVEFTLDPGYMAELWEDCEASRLREPSLDRIDRDRGFVPGNVVFREKSEVLSLGRAAAWKKYIPSR